MNKKVISVRNLTKTYKGRQYIKTANEDLSFELYENEILGILGPNGAGKSTLVKQLIGYTSPDAGEIEILGEKLQGKKNTSLKEIGYMMQSRYEHWDHLTTKEAILYTALLKGIPYKAALEDVKNIINMFELENEENTVISKLSGGKKQTMALAGAAMGRPKVLILDEPTNGLDPEKRILFWKFLKNLKESQNISILLITHNVKEIDDIIDRAMIMNKGKIIKIGTLSDIQREVEKDSRLDITFVKSMNLSEYDLGRDYRWDEERKTLFYYGKKNEITAFLGDVFEGSDLSKYVGNIQIVEPSLEELYLQVMENNKSV